jgi:CBS domain-containing protein
MLVLTDYLGQAVLDSADGAVGSVADLAVRLGGSTPPVTTLLVRLDRHRRVAIPWEKVSGFERSAVTLACRAGELDEDSDPPGDALRLMRDVVDTQIVDVSGRRFRRVADVELERSGHELVVAGVDVGSASILRRLGLRALARRFRGRSVPWRDIYVASPAAHALQLRVDRDRVERLGPAGLAQVVGVLPPARGAEVLSAVDSNLAAKVVSATRPEVAGRVVSALGEGAAPIIEEMATDDAAAALRQLSGDDLDAVLRDVGTHRADTLRRLMAYPPATVGALMSPNPLTAPAGAGAAELRARVAAGPPRMEALGTVFMLDEGGAVAGAVSPTRLLTGDASPMRVPVLSVNQPVDDVVDIFALNDVIAVPVTDDSGMVVGVVTIDDVLDELVAERLPGARRYGVLAARRHAPS